MPRRRRDSVAFTVVVTVLGHASARCAMLLVVALSGAPGTLVLATVLAALPVGPLVGCYLWLDRYEPEPRVACWWPACCGAPSSRPPRALVLQGIGGLVVGFTDDAALAVVAPVTEEADQGRCSCCCCCGGAAHELDGVLDGIVYAGMVGIGFAFIENILYLAAAYNGTDGLGPGGTEALTGTFVLRCLVSPFAHPLFTTFIGIGVGIAVDVAAPRCRGSSRRCSATSRAVLAHALWNGSTLYGDGGLRRRLPAADGAGVPRLRRASPSGPPPLRARGC